MSNEVGPVSETPPVEITPPSPAQPIGKSHGRAAFAFIFITVALDMVALGIIIPVLPRLIVSISGLKVKLSIATSFDPGVSQSVIVP